jgi:hypothetical protein
MVQRRGGSGWIVTSGILLFLAGANVLINGLWALHANGSIERTVRGTLLFSDTNLDVWGWIYTIAGAVVLVAALGVFFRALWAIYVGLIAASISMMLQFFWLFTPYWPSALVTIVLDGLVIWGLAAQFPETESVV